VPFNRRRNGRLSFALVFGLLAALALAGCAQTAPTSSVPSASDQVSTPASSATPAASQEATLYTPAYVPNGREVAVIKTNKGTIRVKLYGKDAPVNTGNFIELALKGFYDKTRFHRLEPGFVVQGGDPQTKSLTRAEVIKLTNDLKNGSYSQGQPMLGTGGPGYNIKGEFDPNKIVHKHVDGTLAMARGEGPDTAGSQFYFTLAPQPLLDGKYTVFGDTVQGLKVVHSLGVGDVIESITIQNASK
jgi:peptidyl-prolyl cis-trans isomerase B (cyclophilin B)